MPPLKWAGSRAGIAIAHDPHLLPTVRVTVEAGLALPDVARNVVVLVVHLLLAVLVALGAGEDPEVVGVDVALGAVEGGVVRFYKIERRDAVAGKDRV